MVAFANGLSPEDQRGKRRWMGIAAALRGDIRTGRLPVGSQLMTEMELAGHFGVSRFTVRRALAELEKEGLVSIEHGRGLFVAEHTIDYAVGERTRWTENMSRESREAHREVLGTFVEEADEMVRQKLELPVGAEVIGINSIAEIAGRPMSMAYNYYPAARFRGIDGMLRANPSSTVALRAFGVDDYTRKSTRIIARLPNAQEARLLRTAKARPVLEVQKVDMDTLGRPICYGVSCIASDRVELVIE